MPQLYGQLASRPGPWLLGRTSAGLCTLQTACPLTVTYSGGSPVADTIAAGSAATVYGGSAATFDASADVWVVLTVPASGALQVVKEADLATVTGDWTGLARVVQHSTEPYQPQAYLGAGGLGTPPTTTTVASGLPAKALNLFNAGTSSNDAPPAGWETSAFDDSAWGAAVVADYMTNVPVPGSDALWSSVRPDPATISANVGGHTLIRKHVSLPAGLLTSASLTADADRTMTVYVNGTLIGTEDYFGTPDEVFSVPPALLLPGADNVIAVLGADDPSGLGAGDRAWISFVLSASYAGTGQIVSIAAPVEGDLAYYHAGAWQRLPIGTTGQELTVVSGDPAWTDQPTDTDTAGTVTSVQVAVPVPLSASGGPITASGTITLAWSGGQSQNRVLASPDGASGAVSLRALVGNDIPVDASTIISSAGTIKGNYQAGSGVSISGNTISATGSGGSVTSVALTVPSSILSVAGSPLTTSGTLAVSLQTQSARTVFAGPASGASTAPTFRALAASDLPAAAAAGGHVHAHGHFL